MTECDKIICRRMSTRNLFVYGTLKAGFCRHVQIASALFLGQGTIRAILYDFGDFPGAFLSDQGEVKGELYELEDDDFATLDWIEGVDPQNPEGSLFHRTLTKVQVAGERITEAWVYVLQVHPAMAPVIADGNYQG